MNSPIGIGSCALAVAREGAADTRVGTRVVDMQIVMPDLGWFPQVTHVRVVVKGLGPGRLSAIEGNKGNG